MCLLCVSLSMSAQNINAQELLDNTIAFHDPCGAWSGFNGRLHVAMQTPKGDTRISKIDINLPQEYFSVSTQLDGLVTRYTLAKELCTTSIKDLDPKAKRTPCETAELYKNYYTYLFGLPMKLKDPGTNISKTVRKKTFKGKEYLVLKASYDKGIGSDVWQFYFDPQTYAMEIYQFFKGDPQGAGKNTGEYILLKDLETINGIKFPKERAWYYNKDNGYLGTDILK